VLPFAGSTVRLGVLTDLDAVVCEFDGAKLPMVRVAADAADAAALAGGDGHLSAAQAGALGGEGGWSVESPVLVAGRTYRYRFHGAGVTTDWFEVSPAEWTSEPVGAVTGAPVGDVAWLVSAAGVHRARFTLPLEAGEHVVGFGERFDAVDQRGRRLDAVVFEQYKAQGKHGRTYLPMPFAHVVGGAGWGFHVRTSRRTWYDVGVSTPDRLTVEVALGDKPSVDVAVYQGSPAAVLTAFLDEVGRAEELPPWVFRLWASGNEWNTQDLVMSRMDTHGELDIPVGVVVIEAWSDEEGIMIFRDATYEVAAEGPVGFTYGGAWPSPREMVDALHQRGIKVILWQIPLLKTDPELGPQVHADGQAMIRGGHAVLESDGSPYHNRGWWFPKALMPDLSVERTRQWWTSRRRYLVEDLDVDGFKTDGGEHAWGHDLRYADGRRGDEGNNLYPVHYARAFGDLLRSAGKAPVTFSRAGFTGSQAHGVYWAGDEDSTWEAFRSSVTAGLTAASCGVVYWGWDLGGFSGPVPDAELYLRAAAASTFMPIMQYHSEFNHHQKPLRDRTPWHVQETTGDGRVVAVFRRFSKLRERLVEYLAEQARVAVRTDRPLMRPLFFDHRDAKVWDYPLQYQLGDDLLVSPVTEPGVSTWTTYLPPGEWVDVWTGESVPAGAVSRAVPIDVVPVYCRAETWSRWSSLFAE
jgi:alpha-glucosidase (family GH31 glycosyl hydrolase)